MFKKFEIRNHATGLSSEVYSEVQYRFLYKCKITEKHMKKIYLINNRLVDYSKTC